MARRTFIDQVQQSNMDEQLIPLLPSEIYNTLTQVKVAPLHFTTRQNILQ